MKGEIKQGEKSIQKQKVPTNGHLLPCRKVERKYGEKQHIKN